MREEIRIAKQRELGTVTKNRKRIGKDSEDKEFG